MAKKRDNEMNLYNTIEKVAPEIIAEKRHIFKGCLLYTSRVMADNKHKAQEENTTAKQASNKYDGVEIEKSNMLMIGPTGSGKTYLCLLYTSYLGDIYTISVNLAGLPGISLPCGMDKNGLPIGLQLIGDCFKEKNRCV